jgi:hypothetical protein
MDIIAKIKKGFEGVDWIHLPQDRIQCPALGKGQ